MRPKKFSQLDQEEKALILRIYRFIGDIIG